MGSRFQVVLYRVRVGGFLLALTRQNAPWIFVKGEPFKIISSLQLLAITVALMVFGPGAEWQDLACHLALTPSTDNQTNAYILDRLMSTAFPASVILMELALQMQERQLELDLQGPLGSKTWRPMPDFTMLAEGKRIEVDLQNLDFKALHVLMGLAEEIDREIVLKRSQAAHQDLAKKLRLTQPW